MKPPTETFLGQRAFQLAKITRDQRLQIGIQCRGRSTLKLADFRQDF